MPDYVMNQNFSELLYVQLGIKTAVLFATLSLSDGTWDPFDPIEIKAAEILLDNAFQSARYGGVLS